MSETRTAPVHLRRMGWVYASFSFDEREPAGDVLPPRPELRVYGKQPECGGVECTSSLTPTEWAIVFNSAAESLGLEPRVEVPVEPNGRIGFGGSAEGEGDGFYKMLVDTLRRMRSEIQSIESSLSASILIGSPWLLVCREPGGGFDLVYGQGYEGQPERCFRWQRGPMLSGAILMEEGSADRAIRSLDASGVKAWKVHERDYLRQELSRLRDSALGFEEMIRMLKNKAAHAGQ